MARSDWTALRTAPAAEYTTRSELERFGLSPYLMQASVRYITPGGITVNKLRPAVARVVLLPFAQAHSPTLRLVPHLQLLPIRIPGAIVYQLML
jgi:hypothetical protein